MSAWLSDGWMDVLHRARKAKPGQTYTATQWLHQHYDAVPLFAVHIRQLLVVLPQ